VIVVYAATAIGGRLTAADEALDAREFTRETVPWTRLAFPSTRDALQDYFAGVRCAGPLSPPVLPPSSPTP